MWEKLALLLAVSVSLSNANCRIGPSYWCASIPQAAQCSAVPFCIQAVWSKERVHKDKDEVCEICKDMVGQARDTLQSNETQEELREVFEGSCDLIPIKVVRKVYIRILSRLTAKPLHESICPQVTLHCFCL